MANLELKGLLALRNLNSNTNEMVHQSNHGSKMIENISLKLLRPGKYQPRKQMDSSDLNELALSVKEYGILQPLIVRKIENHYEIIAGERRFQAAKIAGLEKVPVIFKNVNDNTAFAFALIENLQRSNLNSIEEAESFNRLQNEFSMTHDQISKVVGKSRSYISNKIRLLSLSQPVQKYLEQGIIDQSHARSLLSLNKDEQTYFADKIIKKQLNARQVERILSEKRREKIKNSDILVVSESKTKYFARMEESEKIIRKLNMSPLEGEGGYFVQTYKSKDYVEIKTEQYESVKRYYSTAIYYLLKHDQVSLLHRLRSDEIWHYYAGDPINLVTLNERGSFMEVCIGKEILCNQVPQYVIPKDTWFGAYVKSENIKKGYCLIGCTVSPGFDFEDFELGDRDELLSYFPEKRDIILKLTR